MIIHLRIALILFFILTTYPALAGLQFTDKHLEKQARQLENQIRYLNSQIKALEASPRIDSNGRSESGKRYALVVGNNNYRNLTSLAKAVGDARTVSRVLAELEFNVTTIFDADVDTLDDALHHFYKGLEPGDIAFFFFSGHGVADGDTNYLLPVNITKLGKLERSRLPRKAFNASQIVAAIKSRGVRLVFVVLDACRENPFRREDIKGVAVLGGLTRMLPTEGAFVIFSAGTGQTALDRLRSNDPDPNSVFTRKFCPILKTPGLPIVEIAKRTQVEVRELAARVSHPQAPAYYDQVIGQFYFRRPRPRLFGLVVGINEYENIKLQGAVNDAERVARSLEALGAAEVVRIFNRDARRTFIKYAWHSLVKQADPGDTIVFSYAGSSGKTKWQTSEIEPDGLDEYLMLADYKEQKDTASSISILSPTIISDNTLTEWMELAAAKNVNVILLVDGCYGGGMLDREFANVSFLGAGEENQAVIELTIDGRFHGAMSHAFAEGIEGAADLNGDGFVTQQELYVKTSLEVLRLAGEYQTPLYLPEIQAATRDLALFRLPEDISARKLKIGESPWPETP